MEPKVLPHVHVNGVDHVEFRVNDAYHAAKLLCKSFGFQEVAYADASTGRKYTESVVLKQGSIFLILSQPIRRDSYLATVIRDHGEGVHDVAFLVDDIAQAHDTALARGAIEAAGIQGFDGTIAHCAIKACGPVVHTLIERHEYTGAFAPGFFRTTHPRFFDPSVGVESIDHFVLNVEIGKMRRWADFYERVFGFHEFTGFTEDQISAGNAALRSVVMRSPDGSVTMPINEPVEKKFGHIDEFLRDRHGPGVQHLAFRTPDILATVSALRTRGVEFLPVPREYYEAAAQRLNPGGTKWDPATLHTLIEKLEELGILIDQDEKGYLLQIFTKVVFGKGAGLFFEIIERCGSDGFGEGNFKALFESIERAAGRLK